MHRLWVNHCTYIVLRNGTDGNQVPTATHPLRFESKRQGHMHCPGNGAKDRTISPRGSRLIACGPDLRWVGTPRMEWVAFADAKCAAESTAKNPIFPDTSQAIFAAGRMKSAPRPEQRTDPPLIALNQPHRRRSWQLGQRPHPQAMLFSAHTLENIS